jgi:transposase
MPRTRSRWRSRPRGLLVAALRATGRRVYPINPMAVARYRERHSVSRKKSDHADAMILANILRTDIHAHRPLPADTELARAVAVLARAHQDATWRRSRAGNELRCLLREFHPGFLAAFAGGNATNLASSDARAVLAIAPTPAAAAKLTKARIATALRRGGRQRGADQLAARLHEALRRPQLRQDPMVEQAMGVQALRLLDTLNTECDSVDQLGQATANAFAQHPDYQIITSFTGLGDTTGARVLAEIGDDRARFADARSLKAYAGSAPVTRASGRSLSVTHRKNTTGWPPPASSGPSSPLRTHPEPAPSTTTAASTETATPPLYATCSTACSAASTTACKPARPTTKPSPSQPPKRNPNQPPLDS